MFIQQSAEENRLLAGKPAGFLLCGTDWMENI
jgi:hypothetical protein